MNDTATVEDNNQFESTYTMTFNEAEFELLRQKLLSMTADTARTELLRRFDNLSKRATKQREEATKRAAEQDEKLAAMSEGQRMYQRTGGTWGLLRLTGFK